MTSRDPKVMTPKYLRLSRDTGLVSLFSTSKLLTNTFTVKQLHTWYVIHTTFFLVMGLCEIVLVCSSGETPVSLGAILTIVTLKHCVSALIASGRQTYDFITSQSVGIMLAFLLFFSHLTQPTSSLHYLLRPPREQALTSRLRACEKFPIVHPCTRRLAIIHSNFSTLISPHTQCVSVAQRLWRRTSDLAVTGSIPGPGVIRHPG